MSAIVVAVGNGGGNVVDHFRKESPNIPGVEYYMIMNVCRATLAFLI